MATPPGPLQLRQKEQKYWGIQDHQSPTIDYWLAHHGLLYKSFYTSFINWAIKLATKFRRTRGRKMKPRDIKLRHALHDTYFTNPFQLIALLEVFRAQIYRRQPIPGFIKNHEDENEFKRALLQLWNLLFSTQLEDEVDWELKDDDDEDDESGAIEGPSGQNEEVAAASTSVLVIRTRGDNAGGA